MTADKLEREFAARAVLYSGSLLILDPDDALALIRRAQEERIPILGVDGFLLSPHETISPLEHIADYSSAAKAGSGNWKEATAFIRDRRDVGLKFEITLGNPFAPAG